MTIHEHLIEIRACKEARDWAASYNTAQEVWDACQRIDWLFWWAARLHKCAKVVEAAREITQSVAYLQNAATAYAAAAADAADAAAAAADAAAAAAAADADAAYAAYADTYAVYAANAAADAARKDQQNLNLQIARKHLVCPWHEDS